MASEIERLHELWGLTTGGDWLADEDGLAAVVGAGGDYDVMADFVDPADAAMACALLNLWPEIRAALSAGRKLLGLVDRNGTLPVPQEIEDDLVDDLDAAIRRQLGDDDE